MTSNSPLIFRRLRILLWYLARPSLYSHLFFKLKNVRSPLNHTQEEALTWCEQLSVSTEEALEKISAKRISETIQSLNPKEFQYAYAQYEQCPVKMGGAGDMNLLYWISEIAQAKAVLETGVAFGWSSLAILLSMKNRQGSQLVSIDLPYPLLNNEDYVGCVVLPELRSHWTILRGPDRTHLLRALEELEPIDVCHYDSDKSYEARRWAYPLIWKSLRPGGFLISDDISDNTGFKDFSETLGILPIIVEFKNKYVGILQKPEFSE